MPKPPSLILILSCPDTTGVVLTRAVRWHAERWVLLNGKKTVVLK